MFNKLKNVFGFSPKIYSCDFNKASAKAVKANFPEIYLVKCFFHFVQCIWKNLKKFGLTKSDNIKETTELTYNIKMLCFIDPENIYTLYKKILKKYNDFFNYFNRNWKPKGNFKKIKYIPWNYFNILKSLDFDKKYFYVTNNIAEHINKL